MAEFKKIEQRTTPNGARANLNYQPQTAQNWLNLGAALNDAGKILQAQQARADKLKMQNFEEQINNHYREMNNTLAQSQDPAQFDAAVNGTLEKMKQTGKDYLGDRLFKRWERDYGENYYAALKADTDGRKIQLNQRLAYQTAQDTVKQKAYSYAYAPDAERELMDQDFAAYLENNEFTPLQKQALANQYDQEKTHSRLTYLLDTDPARIAYIDNKGKVVSPMDDEKQYAHLTVQEKLRWKNAALKIEHARKGTALENGLTRPVGAFEQIYADDPLEASRYYAELTRNRKKYMEELKLSPEKYNTYLNYMKGVLENPDSQFAVQMAQRAEHNKAQFNRFEINADDHTIGDKDLRTVEHAVNYIYSTQKDISGGMYVGKEKQAAQARVLDMQKALGKLVADGKPRVQYNDWLGKSSSQWLRDKLAQINAGSVPPLEDLGYLYQKAYSYALAAGFDLNADADKYAQELPALLRRAEADYVSAKYGLPVEKVEEAIVQGRLIALKENPKAAQADISQKINTYLKGYTARQTADGNIIKENAKGDFYYAE